MDRRTFIECLKVRCDQSSQGAQLELQRKHLSEVERRLAPPTSTENEHDLTVAFVHELGEMRMLLSGKAQKLFQSDVVKVSCMDAGLTSRHEQITSFVSLLATAATDLSDAQRAAAARFYVARIRRSVRNPEEYTERTQSELARLPDTESTRLRWSATREVVLTRRDEQRGKLKKVLEKVAAGSSDSQRRTFVDKMETDQLQKSTSVEDYIAKCQATISKMNNLFAKKEQAAARANNAVAAAKFDIYKVSWLPKLREAHEAFANAAERARAAVESAFASEKDKHLRSRDFLVKFVRRCEGRIAFLESPPAQALGGLTDDEKRAKIAAEQRKAERIYDQFRKIMPSATRAGECLAALQRCHDAPTAVRARVASVLREVAVRKGLAVAEW